MKPTAKPAAVLLGFCSISAIAFFAYTAVTQKNELAYETLKLDGVVSGFGIEEGDPLTFRNRIPRIESPDYVAVIEGLFEPEQLCIGFQTTAGWRFGPTSILNTREIVNDDYGKALCYCPLAGLAVVLEGDITISGLLKFDTFVLYDNKPQDLILPFSQNSYMSEGKISLQPLHLLTYSGVVERFPDAKVLNPEKYAERNPYGQYATNTLQGLGHEKPGLSQSYDKRTMGYHPKEMVLIAGFNGRMMKAYPFAELARRVPASWGEFADEIDGMGVTVSYDARYKWASVTDNEKRNLNVAFSYIFAMYQHLPELPIYQHTSLPAQ